MPSNARLVTGSAVVLASMLLLFSVPAAYFVACTFVATSAMVLASFWVGLRWREEPTARAVAAGAVAAAVLYLVFIAGDAAVKSIHPFGITAASEGGIYSLISSKGNPLWLQLGVLLFDAAGYESFFRGVLQARMAPRLGVWAAPAVALVDALVHVATLNPLWVATTFIADLSWGLTYYYGKGLLSSFTSHLLWDVVIFVIAPIR